MQKIVFEKKPVQEIALVDVPSDAVVLAITDDGALTGVVDRNPDNWNGLFVRWSNGTETSEFQGLRALMTACENVDFYFFDRLDW